MTLKVGLIVGREWSFPPAFMEEVSRRDQGVTAEYVKLGAPAMDEPCEYAVIIDRISHEVPFYRTYLKQAVLQGCTVVNNPFMWTADDKFFGAALATKLGIAHPKTVVLPNKEYIPGIVHDESLRNLRYPLDWQGIVDYIGLPCILKDAHGGGWKDVYVCRTLDELIHHYDTSGLLTMIVQEFIEWDHFIRCLCIGQEKVMPIKYDPKERKYHVEHGHMSPELGTRVVADSLKLVRALGYDMNSMEWAVRDGIPYAIDFMNPAPDMDIYSLTPHYFEWVVGAMADMVIDFARNPRRQVRDFRWSELFAASRQMADDGSAGSAGTGYAGSGGTASAAAEGGWVSSGRTAESSATTASDNGGAAGSGGRTGDAGATTASASGGGYMGSGDRTGRSGADAASAEGGPTAASSGGSESTGGGVSDTPSTASPAEAGGGSPGDTPSPEEGQPGAIESTGAGSVRDASPAADLEPPVEVPAAPTHASPGVYVDELPGSYSAPPRASAASEREAHGAAPSPEEAGRTGDDTSAAAADRSAQEQA
jgi:hypothetical protein